MRSRLSTRVITKTPPAGPGGRTPCTPS